MYTEELKDKHGRLLGKIKEINGIYELIDAHGIILGKYNPKLNSTRDAHGRTVGKGNLLASLLSNK